ncbi:MAG TPA: D-glucuronyl C5-epimerase family protein [Terriglobales bacterium]|nr:D-glucuronyl C5-epimerase family protein [Terriglobales bacterium]
MSRLQYYRRIFTAYLVPGKSHLTFWHDAPQENPDASIHQLGEYHMLFTEKADYPGHYDSAGIPMLDYRGTIGLQYNPIAIAQWGLGNYNLFCRTRSDDRKKKFLAASDWLGAHLEPNFHGLWVWNHNFDWEYRSPLKAPWYSALAQGQGISLLVRAYHEAGVPAYLQAAERAFNSFLKSTEEGGITFTDALGNLWFEEYIVSPPTHILNGFIWAAWGVYDYFLATQSRAAQDLFAHAVFTLRENLRRYDLGFWSLYEQSDTSLPMVASPFYHRLHVVQLRVMHRVTGDEIFARYADKWEAYACSRTKRTRALCYKSAFKLCYY